MEKRVSNLPAGPGFPPAILKGSIIARLLHARRGMRDGLTIVELAARSGLSPGAVMRRLTAISGALRAADADGWRLWVA